MTLEPEPLTPQVADGDIGATSAQIDGLAAAAKRGSREAFDELVRAAGPRLVRYLVRRMGDDHLAEDVAQDALVAAHQAMARYDAGRPFMPWLFQIGVRRLIDVQRSASAERRREKAVAAERPDAVSSSVAEEGDTWAVARAVLSDLEHAAMWMRYAEDFDIPEVARAIGKSGVATRVLLLRARRKVQAALVLRQTKEVR
jgi:RNA polymerase sigma-70 factor (ECF subfamily)